LYIFIIRIYIYIKQWFCAGLATQSPNMSLQLIKDLILYEVIDIQISKSALKIMSCHLLYLILEATSLAFFDDKIVSQYMIKMVMQCNLETSKVKKKKYF